MSDIKLSSILSDGMVLQRGDKTKITGKAKKNTRICVTFLNEIYNTISDKDGNWSILLKSLKAGGPYDMIIKAEEKIVIKDILIGDVWLCSGQSNMELPIQRIKEFYEDEILNYSNDNIRQFFSSKNYNFNEPKEILEEGFWRKLSVENSDDFSAVGYFFAKELYEEYKVPIGLISTAVGGTPIEAWMSEKNLENYPRFNEIIAKCKDKEYVAKKQKEDDDRINNWYKELDLKDEGLLKGYNLESLEDNEWQDFIIPGMWRETDLDKFNGSVWFRKEVYLPKELANSKAKLYLGSIIDSDEAYVNGILVGKTEYRYPPRVYEIEEGVLKEGKNIICIRIISNTSIGGCIKDKPYKLLFENFEINLSGVWKYKIGYRMNSLNYDRVHFEYMPTGLYNEVIHPLKNYNISGVIWYQGESNTGYPDDYEQLFQDLVSEWRKNWSIGDFPFLYVQLANYSDPSEVGVFYNWARLREAQRRSLKISNTGMAVTVDIGEYNDLHPFNKKEVGRRLSLLAKKLYYNEDINFSSPIYKKMEVKENKILIYFSNVGNGLLNIKGDINNFEISGEDNKFYKASAKIKESYIEAWNMKVKEPKNIRYAWVNSPIDINLYNKDGLPVAPFTSEEKY